MTKMKSRFRILLVFAAFATAIAASSCRGGGDPYGVNSPSYYGGSSAGMQQNLIRPGTTSRDLYAD